MHKYNTIIYRLLATLFILIPTWYKTVALAAPPADICSSQEGPGTKWPLSPFTRKEREDRVRGFIRTQKFSDQHVQYLSHAANTECHAFLDALKSSNKYRILEPDFVTQDMNDPRVKHVLGSCTHLYLDRDWISNARDGSGLTRKFIESSPTDRDKVLEGVRYTANFEFYDLSRYGQPKGTWAFYADGGVKSCPSLGPCPDVTGKDTRLKGGDAQFEHPKAIIFNAKFCKVEMALPISERLSEAIQNKNQCHEKASVYGLAEIRQQIVAFDFSSIFPMTYFRTSDHQYGANLEFVPIPNAIKQHCFFAALFPSDIN